MENASKAIIIAGGILLGVILIALLVYMFTSSADYLGTEQNIEKTEQLKAFNEQFEAYNRKLLRGTDIVSAINKVINNNEKYGTNQLNEPDYLMNIEFEMVEEIVYLYDKTGKGTIQSSSKFMVGKKYGISDFNNMKQDTEAFTDFKRRVFDCNNINYNTKTGRISYLSFKERKMTEEEYEKGVIYR